MINTIEKIYVYGEWTETYKVTYNDNKVWFVPHDEANRHYAEIQEWIADGGTVIDNGE